MFKILIYILATLLIAYVSYKGGYREGKEDFEREYIPKFKEHSILIKSLSKRVDTLKERQYKLNQCN